MGTTWDGKDRRRFGTFCQSHDKYIQDVANASARLDSLESLHKEMKVDVKEARDASLSSQGKIDSLSNLVKDLCTKYDERLKKGDEEFAKIDTYKWFLNALNVVRNYSFVVVLLIVLFAISVAIAGYEASAKAAKAIWKLIG